MNPLSMVRLAACWIVATVLAGCATQHAPARPAQPAPVLALQVQAPRALAALLRDNLDLGKANRLAGGEPLPPAELSRLMAATPDQARDLLETEGYFSPEVQVSQADGTPPRVVVSVEPGPRVMVADVSLRITGPLAVAAAKKVRHASAAQQAVHAAWSLPLGAPFRQQDWDKAKLDALTAARGQGYLMAQWTTTEARVDASAQRAELSAVLDSGPLYRTGPLKIVGLKRQDEKTVRRIAGFPSGSPATETLLLDFQDRLQKADLFDRTTVTLEPDPAHPESTPVVVQLTERKLQDARFVVGVAANVGLHGSVEHVHRRPFGQPWIMRNTLDLAQLQQRWDGEISTQPLADQTRNLVGAGLQRTTSDTDTVVSSRVRVGRAQDKTRVSRLLFVEAQHSITTSALGRAEASSLALHDHVVLRDVDDVLQPTKGHVWTLQGGVGMARSNPGGNGPFTRLYAKWNGFRPFGDQWHASGRVEAGQVFSRDGLLVPDELLFRAGGDGSVRGYEYRSLTPTINGVAVSGRVLFTSSAEIAHPITERLPDLWGAAFIDAGEAAGHWDDLRPAAGYGVGLRYRSPIGPLRADIAYGQRVRHFRLHLNVGVEF